MKNRIRQLRKDHLKMTQQTFADKLGLSQNFIWQIEKGEREPSDRTISDICREFNIREEWLRTGELPIKRTMSRNAELTKFVGEAMADADLIDAQRILFALVDATPDEIKSIASFARRLAAQYEREKKDSP